MEILQGVTAIAFLGFFAYFITKDLNKSNKTLNPQD